jgi:hypothetical protein
MEEALEEVEALTSSNAGLSIENSELRVYIHELETCVAHTRAGNAPEGLKNLDEWLNWKKRSAA